MRRSQRRQRDQWHLLDDERGSRSAGRPQPGRRSRSCENRLATDRIGGTAAARHISSARWRPSRPPWWDGITLPGQVTGLRSSSRAGETWDEWSDDASSFDLDPSMMGGTNPGEHEPLDDCRTTRPRIVSP